MVATGAGAGVRSARRRRWAAVLAVGVALSLAGCAKDGGSAFTPPRSSSSASSSSSTATSAPAGPVLAAGRVTARRAGVSFRVPDGWQAIDPSSATGSGGARLTDSLRDLAAQSGLTEDEFMRQISSAMDVLVIGRPRGGFTENVSVIPAPTTELPSPELMRSQLEVAGASVDRVDRTTTPIGEALVAKSRLPVGSVIVASRSLVVEVDGRVSYITVSALDWDTADVIADGILRSLGRA